MSISVSTTCHQTDLKLSYVDVHTDEYSLLPAALDCGSVSI